MDAEIRVIVADDHPVLRRGLRQTIESEEDLFQAAMDLGSKGYIPR